jgi:hypothetical protein
MNLIGKILVTLIFVMSLVYLGFATSVYSTHQNWKDRVTKLKADIAKGEQAKNEIQTKLDAEAKKLAAERDAAQQALGMAQQARESLAKEIEAKAAELAKLETDLRDRTAAAATANQNLAAADAKVEKLRQEVADVRTQRDENFKKATVLQDEKNALGADKKRLDDVNAKLAEQVAKAKLVLDRNGLSIETNVDGIPPKVDGIVLAVADNLVELSIGSDDGLARGHELNVSRASKFVGKVKIISTSPEKSVGQVLTDFQKGRIEKDDRVATRIQ